MSDYVPITQGLRDICKGNTTIPTYLLYDECDNIDALHEALEDENAELRKELKERPIAGDAEVMAFVDRLSDAADKREDVTLWGVDYIAGPVDSQGVPITFDTPIERWGMLEVISYDMHDKCWYVIGHDMTAPTLRAEECTVVLPQPTVADVLREFTRTILNQKAEYREQNIAKYAAKLRLAGDAE